uniref:2Fe-2S iron-sulfur cluster-binding protein n=1 Tax=Cellvibrio fontiphilus TaxID=1815559 RepID=UPI002B4BE738|nr:2Fe-2S iron-sulfur cluster-binding protein [Cellvibrio fontiphilus]
MNYISVIDHEQNEVKVDAPPGDTLMEILRDNLFDVAATCSGAGTCGTCHLHVDEAWFGLLPQKDCYEEDTLRDSFHYSATQSRLACQITFDESLSGIRVSLVNTN